MESNNIADIPQELKQYFDDDYHVLSFGKRSLCSDQKVSELIEQNSDFLNSVQGL